MSEPEVIHADNHLLVLHKPAGVPTVPDASGDPSLLDTAKRWVAREYSKPGAVFLGVVHRLDRPVSGVVVFARTSKAAARLTAAFADHRVAKVYWAATAARPTSGEGAVEQWLVKDRPRNVVRVGREGDDGARLAETSWRVLECSGGPCLWELRPRTGRPHQLRVALSTLGHPLLGDLKYGADSPLDDKSVALHARRLELAHPTRGVTLRFEAPPPDRAWWRFEACDDARRRGATVGELGAE